MWSQPTKVALDLFQALPLGQQLEAKPPTGPLAGVETVSVPVATVAAASVPAASIAAASGQAPPTSTGTIALDSHHIRSNKVGLGDFEEKYNPDSFFLGKTTKDNIVNISIVWPYF